MYDITRFKTHPGTCARLRASRSSIELAADPGFHDNTGRRARAGGAAIIASVGGQDLAPYFAGQSLNGISHHHSSTALRILEQLREGVPTDNQAESHFYDLIKTAAAPNVNGSKPAAAEPDPGSGMPSPSIKPRSLRSARRSAERDVEVDAYAA